jgi:hypothetical protein
VVYGIDFFGRGIVYYISSAMTGAIADEDGTSALAQVIQQPGYEFVLRYTRLKSYGKDDAHPRPGGEHRACSTVTSRRLPSIVKRV